MNGKDATNQAAAAFDDTELKCLLLGDENERQKAGDTLLQQFGFRLMGKLRRFTLLSDDEKGSVIHDTIIEVLKKAEKADLDLDQPLIGLLLWICQCKAIDLTRQKTRETGKDDELTEEIGEALADTQVGVAWKRLRRRSFMTLAEILKMGDDWQSSARSAAIRYVRNTGEACAMVVSKQGKLTRYIPSDEADGLGYRFTGTKIVPESSAAHRLNNDPSKHEVEESHSTTKRWFPYLRDEHDLHEESFRLGGSGYVLTLLSISYDEDERE